MRIKWGPDTIRRVTPTTWLKRCRNERCRREFVAGRAARCCPPCTKALAADRRHLRWAVRHAMRGLHPGEIKPLHAIKTHRIKPRKDGRFMFRHRCPNPTGTHQCEGMFVAGKLAVLCGWCHRIHLRAKYAKRNRSRTHTPKAKTGLSTRPTIRYPEARDRSTNDSCDGTRS